MEANWIHAASLEELRGKDRLVVRTAGRQIAIFETPDGVFACNNRCPHEGYPLREGSLEACQLTCNWHNWKFDLRNGENLTGGDRLRTYPVELRQGEIWIDLADPPPDLRRATILENLREAFEDSDYSRLARELARLRLAGGDAAAVLASAIHWSHDRLEFGWTHAYAGAADWLALHDERGNDPETQLICLVEAIDYIAETVLREPVHEYAAEQRAFDEDGFVAAVEAEDEAAAVVMVRGGLAAGMRHAGLDRACTRAALAHYADFGHSLIYVAKCSQLIGRLGDGVALPLLLGLVRSLVAATREDLIPEFRAYPAALSGFRTKPNGAAPPTAESYRGLSIAKALDLTASSGAPPETLYRALLGANAANMLGFDLRYAQRNDGPPADNVGWLDFTHGLTFANAVRRQCGKFPELWPQGLLQLACFAGRNAGYADRSLDAGEWRVADAEAFLDASVERLFDHGMSEYIVSVHLLKTTLAVREEVRSGAAGEAAPLLLAALNRFLHSPLRRKAVRRTMRQAMQFVALDG